MASAIITFDGRFEYRTDTENLENIGRFVCFVPSKESAKFIPRPSTDRRSPWFCLTDTAKAIQNLKINVQNNSCGVSGNATIQVQDYVVYSGEGDGFDTATLNKVLKISESKELPCH